MGTWIWIWICICGGFLCPKWKWFRWPERLVIFTFGLVFSKGLMALVLQNLSSFLTDSLNLKLKEATTIVNLQEGLRNMLQICVALCIDAYLGYRWMLILSSLLYSAGLFLLALSVPGGEGCPSNCFKELKHTSFWEGLTLVVVGGAAQVIPLRALSFEQTRVAKSPEDCEPARVQVGCFRFTVKIGGWRYFLQKVIRWLLFVFLIMGSLTSVFCFFFYYDAWQQHFVQSAVAIFIGLLWFLCGLKAPMSASWLLLQFIFLGAMEGLAGDGILNFFGHYVPDSRRYAPVFTSSLTGFGTILSIGFIAIIDYYSRFRYKESWIGESVNESRLDLIYRAYAMLAVLNCFIYAYVASSYSYDNIIGRPENEQEIPVLEVQHQQETAAGDQQNKQEQEEYQLQRMPVR
ncbi:hypothetical protein GOBAR_DD28435 [Gossypium barbadense]|nr:hypothetical protein GOBAR_DD28435 [Gossypium barbadense]